MSFPEQPFGFVAGRWVLSIGDTPDDADRAPDYVPVKDGGVVFTPQVSHRVATDGSGWAGIIKDRVFASVGERGQLVDAEGHDHLALAVGVYSVSYDFGLDKSWPSHYIEVKQEHTAEAPLWLPPIAPAPEGPMIENRVVTIPADGGDGQVLVWDGGGFSWDYNPGGMPGPIGPQGPRGLIGPEGPEGPQGPQGPAVDIDTGIPIQVDTTVGTRVFIGGHMVYGDTGWRDISSLVDPASMGPFTGGTSSYCEMRREGDLVTVRMSGVSLVTKTAVTNVTPIIDRMPVGYRTDKYLSTGAAVAHGKMLSVGSYTTVFSLDLRGIIDEGDATRFTARWHTTNAWPDTLPGTPR